MYRIKVSEREYSVPMLLSGLILMVIRLRCYIEYRTDEGYYKPELSHISYLLSFLCCFALISSFRQPVLNAIPFVLLPSYIITIPFWDVPWMMRFHEITTWEFINACTLHIPGLIMGLWVFKNRKELMSFPAIVCALTFGLPYFFIVDNKSNEVVSGMAYTIAVVAVAFLWLYYIKTYLLKETNMRDPFNARLVILEHVPASGLNEVFATRTH